MKRKTAILIAAGVVVAGALAWGGSTLIKKDSPITTYTTEAVTRDTLRTTISGTGTLEPVHEVDVGTQVSGKIIQVLVDYNDKVKVGQPLAMIDTLQIALSIRSAKAKIAQQNAQLDKAQIEYNRALSLSKQGFTSEDEVLTARVAVDVAKATLEELKIGLESSELNLSYTKIVSPVNGVVVERNVEAGQTVAASLSSPTLFVIAEDLDNMQILAAVDESDIGQIKKGQSVQFEVPAYPDEKFNGEVDEIRLQPDVVSNVVTYTAVISTINRNEMLMPGMTAYVDFIVEEHPNVLMVPSAAFRVTPDSKMELALNEFQQAMKSHAAAPDGERRPPEAPMGEKRERPTESEMKERAASTGMLYVLGENGSVTAMPAFKVAASGTEVEVKSRGLKEGMKVITGTESKTKTSETTQRPRNILNGGMGMPPPPPRR